MPAVAIRLRRLHARRPWIYWALVVLVTIAVGVRVLAHVEAVDAERRAWGEVVSVYVATADVAPGEAVLAERRELPAALLPERPASEVDGAVARQRISVGEIVTATDLAPVTGPLALVPAGWLAVPVVESPTSGAVVGDRVQVVADGVVLSAEAMVVGHSPDATLVAVRADEAPLLPAADRVALLRVP